MTASTRRIRGAGGDKGGRGQLLVAPLRPFAKELSALGIGVARNLQIGQDDVVGQRQIVVTQRFAFSGDMDDRVRVRQRTRYRQVEPELHLSSPRPFFAEGIDENIAQLMDQPPLLGGSSG